MARGEGQGGGGGEGRRPVIMTSCNHIFQIFAKLIFPRIIKLIYM